MQLFEKVHLKKRIRWYIRRSMTHAKKLPFCSLNVIVFPYVLSFSIGSVKADE